MPMVQGLPFVGLRHETGGGARRRQIRRALRGKDTPAKIGGPGGAYLLLLTVPEDATISVGRLGRLQFRAGNYVYVGSAMAGLEARVARHLRRAKRKKWHIDFLLEEALTAGAVLFPSSKREECDIARLFSEFPGAIPVGRFGSTDCGCPAHLFYIGTQPFGALLMHMDRAIRHLAAHGGR